MSSRNKRGLINSKITAANKSELAILFNLPIFKDKSNKNPISPARVALAGAPIKIMYKNKKNPLA